MEVKVLAQKGSIQLFASVSAIHFTPITEIIFHFERDNDSLFF